MSGACASCQLDAARAMNAGPLYRQPEPDECDCQHKNASLAQLQSHAGNQAIQRRLAGSGASAASRGAVIQRQAASALAQPAAPLVETAAEGSATAAEAADPTSIGAATATVGAAGAASSLFPFLPPMPSLTPCSPASSLLEAQTLHAFVHASWLRFASAVFGSQTESVWASYLDDAAGIPRPARAFRGGGEIVNGFTAHHKSAEAEMEVAKAASAALASSPPVAMPPPGGAVVVPLTSVVPAAALSARINTASDPMGLDYDSPASTIPGNIAGGIGSGGPPGGTAPDPDTRGVDGVLVLSLDAGGTNLTITPALTFHVHDTVDFCPGALGGLAARAETVPMSVLEATEGIFGPVFAADVPFDVDYPGPGKASTTVAITPPPSPPPPPPSPAPPGPAPGPTPGPTPTMHTVVRGDTLWDLARSNYADPQRWKDIYAANRSVIGPDPNRIFPGQVLTIP